MTTEAVRERNMLVADLLHELDELKARPSQHSAAHIRQVVSEAREMLHLLVTDLRGYEYREATDECRNESRIS